MKERIEEQLGILLNIKEFEQAEAMADAKLRFIIRCHGDAEGKRYTEEYREQLIYEAALHNAFAKAVSDVTMILLDMKKECLENPEHPSTVTIS